VRAQRDLGGLAAGRRELSMVLGKAAAAVRDMAWTALGVRAPHACSSTGPTVFGVFLREKTSESQKMLVFSIILLTFGDEISNLPSYCGHYVLFKTVL
jgi:hypothetical protein